MQKIKTVDEALEDRVMLIIEEHSQDAASLGGWIILDGNIRAMAKAIIEEVRDER